MLQIKGNEMKLASYSMQMTRENEQSHFIIRLFVPEQLDSIVVSFSYQPEKEENQAVLDSIIKEQGDLYNLNQQEKESISSLRNLITLSVTDPVGYRGSCHRFETTQTVRLAAGESTPGMLNRSIKSGMWDFAFNMHAVVTQTCQLDIQIKGFHEKATNRRWFQSPFEKLEKKKHYQLGPIDSNASHTYLKGEIHTHTDHSDGGQTVEELVGGAKAQNIDFLAITDHNTMSATEQIASLANTHQMKLIRGMELTTFYGHFLTLGYQDNQAENWVEMGPSTLEETLVKMKEQGVLVGIAHPYSPGTPFCTGCHWEYELKKLDFVDFIEVWNSDDPHLSPTNIEAFQLWTRLLNEGHRISATCGRDWHVQHTDKQVAYLFAYLPQNPTEQEILRAIQNGHTYISCGPELDFTANNRYVPGMALLLDEKESSIRIDLAIKQMDEKHKVVIESNNGTVLESKDHELSHLIEEFDDLKWLRVSIFDDDHVRVAFTNPIYIEGSKQREL